VKIFRTFNRIVPKWLSWIVLFFGCSLILAFLMRWLLPIYRVGYRSQLVMIGDFNNDHRWDKQDRDGLQSLLANPFAHKALDCARADANNDGRLDEEDIAILEQLFAVGDPYAAEAKALEAGHPFPRPRELYRYLAPQDYVNRPLWALPYTGGTNSPLDCLREDHASSDSAYERELWLEVYNEAVRFDLAYRHRLPGLTGVELEYSRKKIDECNRLFAEGQNYDLLLALIGLVEDTETLTTHNQDRFVSKTLFLRDDLRELLASPKYSDFEAGRVPVQEILGDIERLLKKDLSIDVVLEKLGKPRDLKHLENYISRTEWQYYKSSARTEQFEELIHFAQHDRRYLRAVSRTSPKHSDMAVENHNLPMVLLFREALRITGNKKAAVGLIDESIRIPLFWVKSIPREKLPNSVALENFLLPGNKEDGADKSRHWNVFGGICLYKTPAESLDLALKREMQDLREEHYSAEGMTEFIRDTIANLNGIYYVVSMNPDLLKTNAADLPATSPK
jgi:hypothetical protein